MGTERATTADPLLTNTSTLKQVAFQRPVPWCLSAAFPRAWAHIGHLTEEETSHLASAEIPHMADVSGGFFLYTGSR